MLTTLAGATIVPIPYTVPECVTPVNFLSNSLGLTTEFTAATTGNRSE